MSNITDSPSGGGTFKSLLTENIPHLRAFARNLCGRADLADDLVQETMLKAWSARERFQEGSSIRAWTFTILRNVYISQMRRKKFNGEFDELVAERRLAEPAKQHAPLELQDLQLALQQLPEIQREAIILVGAGGFSYQEAAEICGCAVGTIKSRVSRARATLETVIEDGTTGDTAKREQDASKAFGKIIDELHDVVDAAS